MSECVCVSECVTTTVLYVYKQMCATNKHQRQLMTMNTLRDCVIVLFTGKGCK